MSVGVMKDYKIKLRNLRASHKYGNTEDRVKKKEKEKILASRFNQNCAIKSWILSF